MKVMSGIGLPDGEELMYADACRRSRLRGDENGAVVTATAVALSEIATIDELAALCSVNAPSADSVAEPVESNALRGLLAGAGLVPYVARCGTATDEFEVQIADLVGDLHHLADALGVMWPSVLARAEDYHREERLGV